MAFWSKKTDEMQDTFVEIEQNPGVNSAQLAERLGVAPSTIIRRLPSMSDAGFLLYEDDKGGLWPFGKRKS